MEEVEKAPEGLKIDFSTWSNKQLLDSCISFAMWFGDDYCLTQPRDQDYEEAALIEEEILKRMNK